jgi:hypothetical protein
VNTSFNILVYALVTVAGGNDLSPENLTPGLSQLSSHPPPFIEKKVKPLLITHIEKKCISVQPPPPSAPSNDRKILLLVMQVSASSY